MNLCIVSSGDFYSTYGGGQVYVKNIVDEFIRQGIPLSILSLHSTFPLQSRHKEYKGVDVWELSPNGDVESVLRNIRPDVVHAHGEKALIATLCKKMDIRCVVTAHHGGILCPAGTLLNSDDEICHIKADHSHCLKCYLRNIRTGLMWYPLVKHIDTNRYIQVGKKLSHHRFVPFVTPIGQAAWSIQRKYDQWKTICDNADIIIAPSNAIADSMIHNGAFADKVKVVPHGIPQPTAQPTALSTTGTIRFYYVGRICYIKGIHNLLQAFSDIVDDNIELHLIGGASGKSETQYMLRLKKTYRHDHRIVWHGKVPSSSVEELSKNFHVLVHPAIYLEVFGLNISEALALRKYVISTRCGGAEMQIRDGINGTLVASNDIAQLRRAMSDYIHHPKPSPEPQYITIEQHIKHLLEIYSH